MNSEWKHYTDSINYNLYVFLIMYQYKPVLSHRFNRLNVDSVHR